MIYNHDLAYRVSELLSQLPNLEEKEMFSGLVFMVNGKMCVGVSKNELMVRMNPNSINEIENIDGWRQMTMGVRTMKGYVLVAEDVLVKDEDLKFWVNLALAFNPLAKASKKKRH